MTSGAIELSGVSRVYGKGDTAVGALDEVSLQIPAGQFVVLLGPSGSGKTTLLNVIGGIDRPTAGSVVVDDLEVTGLRRRALTRFRREHVAFVFQFFNLVPTLTALENVQLTTALAKGDVDRCATLLDEVGLEGLHRRFPSSLSGGQQQRVAIARALAKPAGVLLCDEPTGALDQETGATVLHLLRERSQVEGRTVVVVSHDPSVAVIADRVIRLVDGRVDDDRMT